MKQIEKVARGLTILSKYADAAYGDYGEVYVPGNNSEDYKVTEAEESELLSLGWTLSDVYKWWDIGTE